MFINNRLFLIIFIFNIIIFLNSEILDDNLIIREIKPDLFIVTDSFPWSSNSLVAIMENNDIVIIDTPYTPKSTEILLNWIDKKYGNSKIIAINTHFHIDRLGGNEALVKAGVPIYSSELTIKEIKEKGQKSVDLMLNWIEDDEIRDYYRNFKYVNPTEIFNSSQGLILKFGSERIEVKYFGTGHTIDNLIVFLPEKKAIFAGCMILSMETMNPGNVSDGNINQWLKTIKKIKYKNYDLIIPGHGKEGGVELINHTKEILKKYNKLK